MGTEFEREVCQRLPLAEAVLQLGQFVLGDEHLNAVFRQHRGRSLERVISFPLFVKLIGDALLEHEGIGHQAFTRAIESGQLEASPQAASGKLHRVPPGLSCGFLADSTARLRDVFPEGVISPVPESLRDFRVINLDGKKIKHLPKRLLPARKVRGHVYGGKLLVAMDQRSGLTLAMETDLDGEGADTPLVPGLLAQLRSRAAESEKRLYVEDRQFCDLVQPGLLEENEFFLVRYQKKVGFHRDGTRAVRSGKDSQGLRYEEEWGWLGPAHDPRRVYVRRITLFRPGDEDVVVATNLWDADAYPAADLLTVYRHRWDIETLFERVTEVFHLRHLISSTPQATIFQAAYCFLISNFFVVIRAYLAEGQQRDPEAISTYQVQYDVERQLIAWSEVLDVEATLKTLGPVLTAEALRAHLRHRLPPSWSDRWKKCAPTKHTPVEKKQYIRGGHTSIQRLLNKAKQVKQRC